MAWLGIDKADLSSFQRNTSMGSKSTSRIFNQYFKASNGEWYSVETTSTTVYIYQGSTLKKTITCTAVMAHARNRVARVGNKIFVPDISATPYKFTSISYDVVADTTSTTEVSTAWQLGPNSGCIGDVEYNPADGYVYMGWSFFWFRTVPELAGDSGIFVYKISPSNTVDHRVVALSTGELSSLTGFGLSIKGVNVEFYYKMGIINYTWKYSPISSTDGTGTQRFSQASSAYAVQTMGPYGLHCRGTDRHLRSFDEAKDWDISTYLDTYYCLFVARKVLGLETYYVLASSGTTLSLLKLDTSGSVTLVDQTTVSFPITMKAPNWSGQPEDVIPTGWYIGSAGNVTLLFPSVNEVL